MNWTPEIVFLFTYIVSASVGLGVEFISNRTLTPRLIVGTILVYGGVGAAFGMYVGYEYFGGKQAWWKVVSCGALVGVRAIKVKDIGDFMRRMLSKDITK